MQKIKTASLLAMVSLFLVACSSSPVSKPTPSTTFPELSPVEATEEFIKIADASCTEALAVGVVEKSTDPGGFTLVMVPKDQAYQDFSAAYFQPEETYGLIWETDALSACSASMSFSLAKEAGVESDIRVSYNSKDGTFDTRQDLGEQGLSHIRYKVADGMFSSTETIGTDSADSRGIKYGNLVESDLNILKTAVDLFLAEQ